MASRSFLGLRRIVGSIVLLGWLVGLVIWNLPSSTRTDAWRHRIEPAVTASMLRQGWGVFAPNPTTTSHVTQARVTFLDGHAETFTAPQPGPLIGMVRSERWRKWETRAWEPSRRSHWEPIARWITDRFGGVDRVDEVELVHLSARSRGIGNGSPPDWFAQVFYRWDPQRDAGYAVTSVRSPAQEP